MSSPRWFPKQTKYIKTTSPKTIISSLIFQPQKSTTYQKNQKALKFPFLSRVLANLAWNAQVHTRKMVKFWPKIKPTKHCSTPVRFLKKSYLIQILTDWAHFFFKLLRKGCSFRIMSHVRVAKVYFIHKHGRFWKKCSNLSLPNAKISVSWSKINLLSPFLF